MRKLLLLVILGISFSFSSFVHTDTNIIKILANANDNLLFEGEIIKVSQPTDRLKKILNNKSGDWDYPDLRLKNINLLGEVYVSKAMVSIANDRGTSYHFYIKVQNEVERAYNELRDELVTERFNKSYKSLTINQIKAINEAILKIISEAEPRNQNYLNNG